MKYTNTIFTAVLMTAMILSSCGGGGFKNEYHQDTLKVYEKEVNLFDEVTIGKQVWMTQNLNVDKFRNGDTIPNAKTIEEWVRAGKKKQPAYCYYENHKIQDDPQNGDKYGILYNWYALNDARGLAPLGWHIPSDDEWTILTNQHGGRKLAYEKLKSTNSWPEFIPSENRHGTDSVGFNALPGGCRKANGEFGCLGGQGGWWSSSTDNLTGEGMYLHGLGKPFFGGTLLGSDFKVNGGGMSVRCIKD